jgi:hypothetical protein
MLVVRRDHLGSSVQFAGLATGLVGRSFLLVRFLALTPSPMVVVVLMMVVVVFPILDFFFFLFVLFHLLSLL